MRLRWSLEWRSHLQARARRAPARGARGTTRIRTTADLTRSSTAKRQPRARAAIARAMFPSLSPARVPAGDDASRSCRAARGCFRCVSARR